MRTFTEFLQEKFNKLPGKSPEPGLNRRAKRSDTNKIPTFGDNSKGSTYLRSEDKLPGRTTEPAPDGTARASNTNKIPMMGKADRRKPRPAPTPQLKVK